MPSIIPCPKIYSHSKIHDSKILILLSKNFLCENDFFGSPNNAAYPSKKTLHFFGRAPHPNDSPYNHDGYTPQSCTCIQADATS